MSHTIVQQKGVNTNRLHSPRIWADCPILEIKAGAKDGRYFFDDFINTPVLSTTATTGLYACYADTGGTILQSATDVNGALVMTLDGTAADAATITTGGNSGGFLVISDTASAAKKLWFEARVKVSSITDAACGGFFIGLTEEACGDATADVLAAGAAGMADKDHIGFLRPADDGDGLDIVYTKAGQTDTTVLANAATLVADTYIKVGLVYDPDAPAAKRIKFFLDGVEQTSYVAASAFDGTFPDGEELCLTMGFKDDASGTASLKATIDWWAACQLG